MTSAHDLEFLSVTTVLLVRHGLTATTGQLLTGWTPGVGLDERGRAQAKALGERLAPVPLDAIVTSPLDRCRQTVEEIVAARAGRTGQAGHEGPPAAPVTEERVGECKYGDWTGKPLQGAGEGPALAGCPGAPECRHLPRARGRVHAGHAAPGRLRHQGVERQARQGRDLPGLLAR